MNKKIKALSMATLTALALASCGVTPSDPSTSGVTTPSTAPTEATKPSTAPTEATKPSTAPTEATKPSTAPSTEESSTNPVDLSYTVNVYDIDGELLASKSLKTTNKNGLLTDLVANFDVNKSDSSYGTYLNSINGQIMDSNYYVSIYENGSLASTGVDGLEIDNNDVFDFKMECRNTVESGYGVLDSYDVLVDKTIYHYAKTYMQDALKKATKYTDSDYWTFMSINMMAKNYYDTSIFNVNNLNEEYKTSISSCDVTTLTGANIGKWYYGARLLDTDLTEFKNFYQEYLNNSLPAKYDEYSTPFIISPAYELKLTSDKLTEVLNSNYLASTQWGIDGLSWQVASSSMFDKFDASILAKFGTNVVANNGTSSALKLLPYAALGVSPRTENGDLIKGIFDNFYDSSLNLVKYQASDTDINYSTNQIYASLMAYKVARDSGKKAFLFA